MEAVFLLLEELLHNFQEQKRSKETLVLEDEERERVCVCVQWLSSVAIVKGKRQGVALCYAVPESISLSSHLRETTNFEILFPRPPVTRLCTLWCNFHWAPMDYEKIPFYSSYEYKILITCLAELKHK